MAAVAQRTGELSFIYKSSKRGEALLLKAAALAGSHDLQLAVVVPFVRPADGPGCCGIRGRAWRDMLRQVAEEEAQHARGVLEDAAVPHSITVVEGSSVAEIVEPFVTEGERQLALPKSPSGTVFSRSELRRIRRLQGGRVQDLSASP